MFRAAVLSIVLTLAIGPSATVLCSVWCHPEIRASACQHQDASPLATADNNCRVAPASATAFVPENSRPGSPAQQAIAMPRFRFAPSLNNTIRAHEAATSLVVDTRPLLIALRV